MNRGRIRLGAVALMAALAFAVPAANADTYTFRDLKKCCDVAGTSTPFTDAFIAAAVNDDGDVAGTAVGPDGDEAYLLKNGAFTVLQYLPTLSPYPYGGEGGNPFTGANDLNDSDVVVGWSSDGYGENSLHTDGGGEHPVAWRPFAATDPTDAAFDFGQFEASTADDGCDQTTPTDCYGFATNINADDDVTGVGEYADYPNAENDFFLVPFMIPGGHRPIEQVPATVPGPEAVSTDMVFFEHEAKPFGGFSTTGINSGTSSTTDQIVVSPDPSNLSSAGSAVCTTSAGGAPKCTSVPLDTSPSSGVRHAINGSGWVIGTDDTTGIAQVWEKGTVVNLPPLSGDTGSEATAINDVGDIVGSSIPGGDSTDCPSAVLWPAGNYNKPINLDAAESTKDEDLFVAQDISDTGDIVGQGGICNDGSYVGNADPWELIAPTPVTAKLTVALAGTGHGTVTAPSSFISCPGTCSHDYPLGMMVTVAETPASTSTFAGWSGVTGCSAATTCVVTMTKAQDLTAKFNGPSPPKCTLKAQSDKVLLKASKKTKGTPGTLAVSVKCNQSASASVGGVVVELVGKKPKHGKQKTKTFKLKAVRKPVSAGKTTSFTLKLPGSALKALKAGAKESVALTLVASNVNGSGQSAAAIGRLKGVS
jgi:uncharacterized membrane protein